jgi:Arc/MetJ family transcription regulator
MKTTVELDEKKLNRIMKLTGIRTRKEAINFALTEAERIAKRNKVLSQDFYLQEKGPIVDPAYHVLELREKELPGK